MSERQERRAVVYVDYEAVRSTVEASGGTVAGFAEKIALFAKGHGRLLSANLYGDLSAADARLLRPLGVDARLTYEDGEGSAPESISIALDAAAALAAGPHVDAVVLATDDAQLTELVRRLRREGRYVVAVVPAALTAQEFARAADRALTVEALMAGPVEAVLPVAAEPARAAVKDLRESPPPRPRGNVPAFDADAFDGTRLVLLLRDLEARMPFVGMRWLKNKVLGPHNVGTATVADKQALLNRAVDEGLVETYRVGNRDEGGEPVTACRLLRESEKVRAILASNPAAEPAAHDLEMPSEQPLSA